MTYSSTSWPVSVPVEDDEEVSVALGIVTRTWASDVGAIVAGFWVLLYVPEVDGLSSF